MSGVSAVGGANTQYCPWVFSGLLIGGHYNWDESVSTLLWKDASDPEHDLAWTVGTTLVAAGVSAGVGAGVGAQYGQVAGDAASNAFDVSVAFLSAASEKTKCDAQASRRQRKTIARTPFIAGQEYKVFITLDSWTKGVAAGLAGGFAEVGFYGKRPDACDKGSTAFANSKKGIGVSKINIVWE